MQGIDNRNDFPSIGSASGFVLFAVDKVQDVYKRQLLSLTRQALDTYGLIQDGDRIAIGVSGGKDSLTLLHALHHLRRFYPEKYELCAITVDLGLGNMDLEPVAAMCREFEIPYEIISTEIGAVLFDIRKETNPCSLCAKMRKGALNELSLIHI